MQDIAKLQTVWDKRGNQINKKEKLQACSLRPNTQYQIPNTNYHNIVFLRPWQNKTS
jgi:hypothetical protein